MDFDLELTQIQGALMKANNSFPFKSLTSRGGNEETIKDIVDVLYKLLTDKGYICEKKINESYNNTLRRISFFLILNTDLKFLDELVDSDDIGHLIWVTPSITRCLLIHLTWGLNIGVFYCEAIRYSNPELSLELLDIAAQYIKYATPGEGIQQARNLVASSYEAIIRMLNSTTKTDFQEAILSKVYNKMYEIMKCFTDPPNKHKMANWKTKQLYTYAGNAMLNIFQLLIECFTIFLNKPSKIDCPDLQMYSATFQDNLNDSTSEKTDNSNEKLDSFMIKLNDMLLEAAKVNLMSVNIDIYCSWSENVIEESSGRTLQRAVGELAHQLEIILKSDLRFENEIITMLPTISCKPVDLSDLIGTADKETILKNASETSDNQKQWLKSLINSDSFFSDEDFIECAMAHISMFSSEERTFLFERALDTLCGAIKNEYSLKLKHLARAALASLDLNMQVSQIIDAFSTKELDNHLELPDHDSNITEFLNKLIDISDSQLSELYILFVTNPVTFIKRIYEESIKNVQQTMVMLSALEKLKVFYGIQYKCNFDTSKYQNTTLSNIPMLLLHALNEINMDLLKSEFEIRSFVHFIKGITERDIIDYDIVLLKYLMPALHGSLTSKNFKILLVFIQTLQETICLKRSSKYISPLLVMLAQVMEASRWAFDDYSPCRVEVVETAIKFQSEILNEFLVTKTPADNEFVWLSTKLSFLTPINAYYFQKLWPLKPPILLLDPNLDEKDTQVCLSFLLSRTTVDEWKLIFSSIQETAKDAQSSYETLCSIINLFSSSDEIKSENALACLENCCRNTAQVLEEIIPATESLDAISSVLKTTVNLLNNLPEQLRYGCFLSLMSPLYAILQTVPASKIQQVITLIEELKCEESKKYLNDMILSR